MKDKKHKWKTHIKYKYDFCMVCSVMRNTKNTDKECSGSIKLRPFWVDKEDKEE